MVLFRLSASAVVPALALVIAIASGAVLPACDSGGEPAAPDAAAPDGGWHPAAPTCEAYCDRVIASCGVVTGVDGGDAQYLSREGCLAQCSTMTPGTLADRGVDTVGCRLHHAELAATDRAQCRAAGSNGGGVCGADRCAAFCSQAVARCDASYTSRVPYATYEECYGTCSTQYTFDASRAELVFSGADLNCRIGHLVAANDPSTAFGPPPEHCWHIDRAGTGGFCTPH